METDGARRVGQRDSTVLGDTALKPAAARPPNENCVMLEVDELLRLVGYGASALHPAAALDLAQATLAVLFLRSERSKNHRVYLECQD